VPVVVEDCSWKKQQNMFGTTYKIINHQYPNKNRDKPQRPVM
jgi:hypothetical protein